MHWKQPSNRQPQTTLNYYPDANLLKEGIALLAANMGWKKYVIIYENEDSLVKLEDILKLNNEVKKPVQLYQLDAEGDYRLMFKQMKAAHVNNIILECGIDKILPILRHAKEVGMLEYMHSYLLTNVDSHTVDLKSLASTSNITTVRIIDPERRSLHNVVSDWQVGEHNHNRYTTIEAHTVRVRF